jgi:HEAT repeat protein
MYATLALGNLKDRRAIPALTSLLKDSDLNVRYHAIEALARLRASEAAHALAEVAESGEFFLAFAALDALAAIGDSTVAPRLVPLLDNENIRPACINALAQLGDHSVVAPLVVLLDQRKLVSTVVEALTRLHQRYEHELGEGEYIGDLVARQITTAGMQNLLDSLHNSTGDTLRMTIRILGWIGSGNERVIDRLTQMLGSPNLRSEVIETLVRHGDRVTRQLRQQLESDDLEIRQAAVIALGRIGDRACVPQLIPLLQVPELAIEAASALARIGDRRAYEPLLQLLPHDRAAVRQAVIGALNSLGHPRMPKDIQKLLTDSNPHTRESALRIASYFGYSECVPLLIDRLNDGNENVRRAAVESLSNFEDERVMPLLQNALRDPSAKIRTAAAQSFGHLENPAYVSDVIRALSDPDAWVRYYAARALGQIRSPESLDPLAVTLREDEAPQVRIAAAEALGSIGGRRAVSILAAVVSAEDRDLGRAALLALGVIGHPDALGPIASALRSNDSSRRLDAVHALAMRRDSQAAESLQWAAAADREAAVAEAAIEELGRMATPESIASLLRLASDRRFRERAVDAISRLGSKHLERITAGLSSPHLETRRAVVDALGRMRHPSASESLRTALDDEWPEVRLAAVVALKRLGSLFSERKVWNMVYTDPDPGVRTAAEQALQR